VLLDCNESELAKSVAIRRKRNPMGAVRPDDENNQAVQRRLELYRLHTLPTLKVLDEEKRLFIVRFVSYNYFFSGH